MQENAAVVGNLLILWEEKLFLPRKINLVGAP